MLREIHIENMAIFSSQDITFRNGMSVLTGETGAGKSLIIGAISLLLGARTVRSYIKEEGQSLHVEALFSTEDVALTEEERALYGDELLITREFSPSGRSSVRVNQRLMTTAALKELGQKLICIHGQHDNQALLNENAHLQFLDDYANISLDFYQKLYIELKNLKARKDELEKLKIDAVRKSDYLSYAIEEIERIAPKPNEDVLLQEKKNRLKNAQKLYRLICDAENALSGSGEDGIGEAYACIKSAAALDPLFSPLEEKMIELYDFVQTVKPMLCDARESIIDDPESLTQVLDRISELEQLKRKYGGSIESILSYKEECEYELKEIEGSVGESLEIDNKISELSALLEKEAARISELRSKASEKLSEKITEELGDLGMEKARFFVSLKPCPLYPEGAEKVQFQIETNPGSGAGPLAKIASGGELSRVMLALKAALHEIDSTPTIIFDEIDVGISGSTAQKVGRKMKEVSKDSQVIAVTHLQQIAAFADTHYKVTKKEKDENDSAYTAQIKQLTDDERVFEIVRLMVGDEQTDAAILAAKELLNGAKNG